MEELKLSEFNEAAFKMARINKLQEIINIASVNKLGFFMSEDKLTLSFNGKRNYEVIFFATCCLFMETHAKLSPKEIEELTVKRNVINYFIREIPVFTYVNKLNGEKEEVFNVHNWVVLENELTNFEEKVRNAIDKHGFSGKESKDPRYAVTN